LSWTSPTADSLYTLQSLFYTFTGPGSLSGDGNYGRYSNKELDTLIDRFKTETDLKKRDAGIRDVLMFINRDLPVVTMHRQIIPWAMSARPGSNVTAVFPPNGIPYFFRFRIQ
jgi:peptide/nickel transport system substrate-binding protein